VNIRPRLSRNDVRSVDIGDGTSSLA